MVAYFCGMQHRTLSKFLREVSNVVDDSSGLHRGPGRGLSRCFSDRTIGMPAVLHRSPVTA